MKKVTLLIVTVLMLVGCGKTISISEYNEERQKIELEMSDEKLKLYEGETEDIEKMLSGNRKIEETYYKQLTELAKPKSLEKEKQEYDQVLKDIMELAKDTEKENIEYIKTGEASEKFKEKLEEMMKLNEKKEELEAKFDKAEE
ncbi:hypothetical protein [Isobaculum melis]|uniref:Uncharacterized protein n=1 Tax=Isobaculum melis TaxID=142588 RepID=A0A1H9PZR7_9LACT|nr:hypothetical protein [Isobaculum melis]SER53073.1 hypothetical protein SAMN04488559_101224 [Isobaculum melis]